MNFKKVSFRLASLISVLLFLGLSLIPSSAERFDILIKNAKIVDGTGKPAFTGSVAIKGEKIVAVGHVSGDAATVIDAKGLVTCPGFIDPHSHADMTLEKYPLAENLVMQGITTVVGGNCGGSEAPTKNLTFGEWLTKLEKEGISLNYVPLVGHSTIRQLVMGEDYRRNATSAEIEEMKKQIENAMRSGAFGLSSFADPSPSHFASIEELVELSKVALKYGGIHSRHTNIQEQWPTNDPEKVAYDLYYGPPENVMVGPYRGVMDAIEISRKAQIPMEISHLTLAYRIPQPHPDFLEEAAAKATLLLIDEASQEGVDVTFDVIASEDSICRKENLVDAFYSKRIGGFSWVWQIGKDEFVERLKTREFRDRIRRIADSCRLKFGMVHTKVDPYWFNCFRILTCKNKGYEGKTIGELAHLRNSDPLETIFDILVEDSATTWTQFLDKRNTDLTNCVFLRHPSAMACTDIWTFPSKPKGDEIPAPISYGLYPHYIGHYIRDKKIISLEEAIKKATSLPAKRFGLNDRGTLSPGKYADIVIFDYGKIRDKGDFLNPAQAPEGIEFVLVNGKIVYKNMAHTGEKAGKVIKHLSKYNI